jgi:GntR family histidine utilization transcriptional repressor
MNRSEQPLLEQKPESRYIRVKNYVVTGISNGSWRAGERVPSENELVDLCKVSRMTARRALQELLFEGTLVRIKGKGSFVAEEKQQSSLLKIRSIATEIKEQGLEHHSELIICNTQDADPIARKGLGISEAHQCGHSQLLHFQGEHPIQLEYRWVNLDIAPDYVTQDFTKATPSEYLSLIAPVTEAEHQIEAILGDTHMRKLLQLDENEAILLLERKTWCNGKLVSYAKLYHPGNRYRLGTKFKTS